LLKAKNHNPGRQIQIVDLNTSKKESKNITMSLSRTDFPIFDGSDPCDWLMKSQYYFGLYQVNEQFKTKLAFLNFTGRASQWYRGR
jgi:hypothetical protein